VVNATERVRAYDLATGELTWQVGGMTTNAIPSPVSGEGRTRGQRRIPPRVPRSPETL